MRSPSDLLMWIRNPIKLANTIRMRSKKFPYWTDWSSLELLRLRTKTRNSYALFVAGQKWPRIVLKKIITTRTSYGTKMTDLWGIIYYDEPGRMFMYMDYAISNFGCGFDLSVSHDRPQSCYNSNRKKKLQIMRSAMEELRDKGFLLWNQALVRKYLSILLSEMEEIEKE